MQKAMYSSKTGDWATPQGFFDLLDAEFHFTLDPCADEWNHKCERYYTKEQNGLVQPWGGWFSAIHHMGVRSSSGFTRRSVKQRQGL